MISTFKGNQLNIVNKIYSNVKVQGLDAAKTIPVTSRDKPEVGEDIREKWQNIIDVLAGCFDVPAGLIMQLDAKRITVFLSSHTRDNPYSMNDSESLLHGLYCETVVGMDRKLLVPDAREDHYWCENPDIKLGMVSYLGFPIKWPDNEIFGTICVLDSKKNDYSKKYIDLMEILRNSIEEDLSLLLINYHELQAVCDRLTENLLALEKTKDELQHSLHEKETLLREIHHRVKNNLQIVSSFVELQSLSGTNSQVIDQLSNIRNRINAMGLLHEILYRSQDFSNIPVREYVEGVTGNLQSVMGGSYTACSMAIEIDENLVFNLDTAIPVGLIVNELVTNSFKHAFSDDSQGSISIAIHENSETGFSLSISDSGCGIPEKNIRNPESLGLEIVNALVRQLNGTMKMVSEGGTSYFISLKRVLKEEKRWLKKS